MRYIIIAALLGATACSSTVPPASSDHGDSKPVCEELGKICHEPDHADGASSLVHDCHVNAHTKWSEETCVARRDECLAACKSAH